MTASAGGAGPAWRLSIAGIALLVGRPAFQGGWIGVTLILAASVSWVAANMQIKRLAADVGGWQLNAWPALLAAPMMLVLSALTEHGQVETLRTAGTAAWFAMAYQVIVTTAHALLRALVRHDAALSGFPGDAVHPAGTGFSVR